MPRCHPCAHTIPLDERHRQVVADYLSIVSRYSAQAHARLREYKRVGIWCQLTARPGHGFCQRLLSTGHSGKNATACKTDRWSAAATRARQSKPGPKDGRYWAVAAACCVATGSTEPGTIPSWIMSSACAALGDRSMISEGLTGPRSLTRT